MHCPRHYTSNTSPTPKAIAGGESGSSLVRSRLESFFEGVGRVSCSEVEQISWAASSFHLNCSRHYTSNTSPTPKAIAGAESGSSLVRSRLESFFEGAPRISCNQVEQVS